MKRKFFLLSCLLSMTLLQTGAFALDMRCKPTCKRHVEKKGDHKKRILFAGCGCGGGGGVKTEELPPDEIKE